MPTTHLDDIALFFSKGKNVAKCWVSHKEYSKNLLGPVAGPREYWARTVFSEEPVGDSPEDGQYYVLNLSKLDDPGVPPGDRDATTTRNSSRPASKKPNKLQAGPGDLVVIPYDEPNNAYLVKKQDYENFPPLDDTVNSDLAFMAVTEGVVLANVPKLDPQGITCFLLNLLTLRNYGPNSA